MPQSDLSDHEWRQMRRQMTSLLFDPVPETPVLSSRVDNDDPVTPQDEIPSIEDQSPTPFVPLIQSPNSPPQSDQPQPSLFTSALSSNSNRNPSFSQSQSSSPPNINTTLDPIFDVTNLGSAIAAAQTSMRQSILNAVTEATTRVEREADLARRQAQAAHLNQMELLQVQIQELQAQVNVYETMKQHEEEALERLSQYLALFKQQTRRRWSDAQSIASCFHGWKRWYIDKQHKRTQRHLTTQLIHKQSQQILLQQWKLLTQQTNSNKRIDMLQQEHQQEMETLIKEHETQLQQMQQEVDKAKKEQSISQQGRQQLEDDLRKVFLRGVSAMNMEATNLFESTYKGEGAAGSLESQNRAQTTGEDAVVGVTSSSTPQYVQEQVDENELLSDECMIPIRPPIPQTVDMSTKLRNLLATSTAKLPPSSSMAARPRTSDQPKPTALIHGLRSAELVAAHQRMLHATTANKTPSSSHTSSNHALSTKQQQRKIQTGLKYQVEMEFLRSSVTTPLSSSKRASPGAPTSSLSPSLSTPKRRGSSKWR